MRPSLVATFVVSLFSALCQAQTDSHIWGRATTDSPPDCSVDCLTTLVPSYCGTLTNTTCICTSVPLSTALSACAYSACNVTETFRFAKYAKDSCGVVSDKSKVNEQLQLYYVLPALATCFVAARVFARWKLEVGLGPDDWVMLAALAAYLTDVAAGLGIALNGFGQHTYYLTTKQVSHALEFFYVAELFYIVSITLTKCSLLLFFNRIFPSKKHRTIIYSMMGFVVVSNFALLMALMFQCVPFHGVWTNWMYKVPPVKCINTFAAIYVAAALSIFHDLAILCFPIPILWSLNLAWQKKANLLVMFSVGSFVIICSLLRLPSLMKMGGSSDPSYDQAPVAVWTDLEIAVGIICGCLPACRSLIGWIFPSLKMTLGNSSGRETPA
ncbi:hypothetical protein BGZ60DRAFT_41417 [Tricladium varicosporioides]|nr:hypothetical protein BGZ60DRAFT_41417 [Hymenoscyphus varicosporioides]